jgi:hypothetical protein
LVFRLVVVSLAALPVGLTACGGDGSSNKGASSSTSTVAGTTAPSGTTGATGTSGATGAATGPTGNQKADSGGAGAPKGGAGGRSNGGAKGGSTNKKQPKKKKPKFLPGSFAGQKGELFKQSREVCGYLTLDGLAKEYNVTPKTPTTVARRYAKGYPASVRDAVYKGCRAGLNK